MEPIPNTTPGANTTPVAYQYLVEQGQAISRLHDTLLSNIVVYGMNYFFSVILQILCYLLFAFMIYLVIAIPSDVEVLKETFNDGKTTITANLATEDLSIFFLSLRIILAIVSLPVLICAFLLGRNRRRAAKMRKAFEEASVLKKSYERMLRAMR